MARFTEGWILRKAVEGLEERAPQRIAWLPRPREIPKVLMGKRRRNGQMASFGRRMSSWARTWSSSGPWRAAK